MQFVNGSLNAEKRTILPVDFPHIDFGVYVTSLAIPLWKQWLIALGYRHNHKSFMDSTTAVANWGGAYADLLNGTRFL